MNPLKWFKERRRRKEEEEQAYYEEQERLRKEADRASIPLELPDDVEVVQSLEYEPKFLRYGITVTNHTGNPLGKPVVQAGINPKLATFRKNDAEIAMLADGDTQTLEFVILPKYTSGRSPIKARLSYFDFSVKERVSFPLDPTLVSFKTGKITPIQADEIEWRFKMSNLVRTEAESSELSVPPATLFEKLDVTLSSIGLFAVDPLISPQAYRAIGRYLGESKKGALYAVQLQVIGQDDISKFLLETYAEDGKAAHSLCYHIIDRIEEYAHCRENLNRDIPEPGGDEGAQGEESPPENGKE